MILKNAVRKLEDAGYRVYRINGKQNYIAQSEYGCGMPIVFSAHDEKVEWFYVAHEDGDSVESKTAAGAIETSKSRHLEPYPN